MWGKANTLPSINSYNEAKQIFENTKPLRTFPDIRPLDRRSKDAKGRIKKVGDKYVIQLYGTDIVTYYPNGDVLLNTGRYATVSTASAIGSTSPFSCWTTKGQVAVCNRYGSGGKYLVQPKLLMINNGEGIYRPVDPPVARVWKKRVKRDVAKQVRQMFKQVPKYIETYCAAFAGGVKPDCPRYNTLVLGAEVTDEMAANIAWGYVPQDWGINGRVIGRDSNAGIGTFWTQMYNAYGCIEVYGVDLPLGEV